MRKCEHHQSLNSLKIVLKQMQFMPTDPFDRRSQEVFAMRFLGAQHTLDFSFRALVYLFLTALSLGACGPKKEDTAVTETPFAGIKELVENPDGTYTLSWPVAAAENPRYLIFQRFGNDPWNYTKPYFTTLARNFTTEPMLFQKKQCFLVRASTETMIMDSNLKEACTSARDVSFSGISNMRTNANGHVIITWNALNISGLKYAVFMRKTKLEGVDVKEDYDLPLSVLGETNYDAGRTPRGEQRCFYVGLDARDSIIKLPKELANVKTKEQCTDYAIPLIYPGLATIDYGICGKADIIQSSSLLNKTYLASSRNGVLCSAYEPSQDGDPNTGLTERLFDPGFVLRWPKAEAADVVGYQVFEGPSLDSELVCVVNATASEEILAKFSNCIKLNPDNLNSYALSIASVSPGRVYHFAVQAFDSFGNSDGNTLSIPIRALDIGELR
jgi:hypothetical protein